MLLPGLQLLDLDIRTDQEERRHQVIPYRDAAEKGEMQIVRECGFPNVSQARVWPGPQDLAIQAFDRDRIRLKRAAVFAAADADEAHRLPAGGSFGNHVFEVAAVP